jgi:hypothetical protein
LDEDKADGLRRMIGGWRRVNFGGEWFCFYHEIMKKTITGSVQGSILQNMFQP